MSDATDQRDGAAGTDEPQALPGDGLREGIVDALRAALGDQLVDTHLVPQTDLWVRVTPEAWARTAEVLKAHGFDYFCFVSAIDWMPSPYGRGEDDPSAEQEEKEAAEMRSGYAGGESRFQAFARVTDLRRHVGVTIKADVPDTMRMPTWIGSYAGANWHERETHEMFGIVFDGHPDLRNIYLPGEFEGFPLRKDFPLLSRMVKPWPGIVDVEPMPAEAADEAAEGSREEPAAADEAAEGSREEPAVADEAAEGSREEPAAADEAAEGSREEPAGESDEGSAS